MANYTEILPRKLHGFAQAVTRNQSWGTSHTKLLLEVVLVLWLSHLATIQLQCWKHNFMTNLHISEKLKQYHKHSHNFIKQQLHLTTELLWPQLWPLNKDYLHNWLKICGYVLKSFLDSKFTKHSFFEQRGKALEYKLHTVFLDGCHSAVINVLILSLKPHNIHFLAIFILPIYGLFPQQLRTEIKNNNHLPGNNFLWNKLT